MLSGVADTYMIGGNIGETLTTGFMFSKVNIRTLIQITGGTLTKALALHMAAVLPSCTGHNIDLDDQYEEDITSARIPVVEGAGGTMCDWQGEPLNADSGGEVIALGDPARLEDVIEAMAGHDHG